MLICIILDINRVNSINSDIKHDYTETLFVDMPTCCDNNNNGNQITTLTIVEVVLFHL